MLNLWLGGPSQTRLCNKDVTFVSDKLTFLKSFVPREFNRKTRSLDELSHWKATEYRTFLLYTGPIVLKDFTISIIMSDKYIFVFGTDLPLNLLHIFITLSEKVYGVDFLIYNVHVLSYICDDVEKYEALDHFSAFPYENYFGQIKKLVPNKAVAKFINVYIK